MEGEFDYFAFISYKREDEKWALWLQHKLESYRLPSEIAKKRSEIQRRLSPIFKDTTDIKPGVLSDVLYSNIKKSKHLIVICSPLSARSTWVGKEISDFISLGKQNNIILFIVNGIPYSNNPVTECFHPTIKEKLPEMLGVNICEKGVGSVYIKKQKAFIRVVSTLIDVSFDSLWQRQRRRIIRNWIFNSAAIILFISAIFGISIYEHNVNQPFNLIIDIKENSLHNSKLPFKDGKVYLCYQKDTLISKPINHYSDKVEFNNIPGKFLFKKASLHFLMKGYNTVDTTVYLGNPLTINIYRDDSFGIIKGQIRDFNGGKTISGAKIVVSPFEAISDKNGYFEIHIPLKYQTKVKDVQIIKVGYKTYKGRFSIGKDWNFLLEKI